MMDRAQRLKRARIDAGYSNATDAAERFGWKYPTYAGHENGSRGFGVDEAKVYARAFKVDWLWLLGEGNAILGAATASGFDEPDLVPFRGKAAESIATLAAPLSRHQMIYRCARDHIGFAVRQDDLVVLGTPNDAPHDGLVVVNMTDLEAGHATTVLRHHHKGVLFAPIGQELPEEDELVQTILGYVLAVIRAPQLVN